jgi:CRP-like cAMP-binding protein
VNKIYPGSGFGEVALVLRCRRTSSVICDGICELSKLDRSSLDELAGLYPADLRTVREFAGEKATQMKMLNRATLLRSDRMSSLTEATMALIVISRYVRRWSAKTKARRADKTVVGVTRHQLEGATDVSKAPGQARRSSFQQEGCLEGKDGEKTDRHALMIRRRNSMQAMEEVTISFE